MFKKIIALVLVTLMAFSLLACAQEDSTPPAATPQEGGTTTTQEGTQQATQPAAAEPEPERPHISILTWPAGAPFPDGVSIMNSEIYDEIVRLTGFDIEWELFLTGGDTADQQAALRMIAGNAPDMIQGLSVNGIIDFARSGGLADLTDAFEQTTFLKDFFDPDIIDVMRIDGRLYAIPAFQGWLGSSSMAARTDWLDELNLPIPTTTDELYDTLVAIKKAKPDVIPLVISGNFSRLSGLLGAFGIPADRNANYIIENGRASFPYFDDRIKNFINYMHRLYVEGLIDPEFLIEEEDISKMLSGVGFMMDTNWVEIVRQMEPFLERNPDGRFEYINAIKGPNGDYGILAQRPVFPMWTVPAVSADRAEVALNFLDLVNSNQEILNLSAFGILGRDIIENPDGTYTKTDSWADIAGTKGYYSRLDVVGFFGSVGLLLEGFDVPLAHISTFLNKNEILLAPIDVPVDGGLIPEIQRIVVDAVINMIIEGYSDAAMDVMKARFIEAGGETVLAQYDEWYRNR